MSLPFFFVAGFDVDRPLSSALSYPPRPPSCTVSMALQFSSSCCLLGVSRFLGPTFFLPVLLPRLSSSSCVSVSISNLIYMLDFISRVFSPFYFAGRCVSLALAVCRFLPRGLLYCIVGCIVTVYYSLYSFPTFCHSTPACAPCIKFHYNSDA